MIVIGLLQGVTELFPDLAGPRADRISGPVLAGSLCAAVAPYLSVRCYFTSPRLDEALVPAG